MTASLSPCAAIPRSPEETADQAVEAAQLAFKDGYSKQRIDFLPPLTGPTDLDDWPGGIRQMFSAILPMVERLLNGVKFTDALQCSLQSSILDNADAVGLWTGEKIKAVLFPTPDALLKANAMEPLQPKLFLMMNPQWSSGQVISDFGFGKRRADIEMLLEQFQSTYVLKSYRIQGQDIRFLPVRETEKRRLEENSTQSTEIHGSQFAATHQVLLSFVDVIDDPECLKILIAKLLQVQHPLLPIGTRVWARVIGYCDWPSVIWSLCQCPRSQWPELVESYAPDKVMVLFYGERTIMWVNKGRLYPISENQVNRVRNIQKWGEKNGQTQLAAAALDELNYSYEDSTSELDRLQQRVPVYVSEDDTIHPEICAACREFHSQVVCSTCKRGWHTLCLNPPVLKKQYFNEGDMWQCPTCKTQNTVDVEEEEEEDSASKEENGEASGLTPDWIIYAAAYEVFLLEKPTPERPFIKDLLDPCTNSKTNSNIPAEKLYDKTDNGLKLSNSWSGYYIILNPDYKSQVQWRFVNRAIDEVENDRVPAVILICRNSTDTAYYQRLRPYPRVLLSRKCVKFKNYENTPIGFGIVVFCIAKRNWKELYCRFLDAFSPFGEMNMPIDIKTLGDAEFAELTRRVHEQAAMSLRDHWMQCNSCKKWRIVPYEIFVEYKDKDWHCSDLKSNTTCLTMQRKVEMMGVTYSSGADKGIADTVIDPDGDVAMEHEDAVLDGEDNMTVDSPASQQAFKFTSPVSKSDHMDMTPPDQKSKDDASTDALKVACMETLENLAILPPRSHAKMTPIDVTPDGNLHYRDRAISCLELARQSTMAANRAYLKGLGEDPSAIHKGKVTALNARNSLVIQAAKQISKKSTLVELELQYQKKRRHLESLKRKQQIDLTRLMKELEKKKKEERDAIQAKEIAMAAVKELEERVQRAREAGAT